METVTYTREHIPELLREHGINPTHQRIEIAHALFSRGEHLSADQILSAVNARFAETSKATVYNTLNLFLQKGLVREVIVDPSKVFYDPNTSEHHHIYNVSTGTLSDVPASDVRLVGVPALPDDVVTEAVDVIIRVRSRGAA